MVKYYYDKYEATPVPVYTYSYTMGGPWQGGVQEKTGYADFSFDPNTGKFTLTGIQKTISPYGDAGPVYVLGGNDGQQLLQYFVPQYSSPIQYKISTVTQTLVRTDYTRGALVQQGIAAEDGTYPANGRHSDGYWYVKGAVVKTAPTMPGSFTQPTGTLEIGDSKVISWGASTDAENNLSVYVLEASINGGSFAQIATPATNSHTYTIPTATSVVFRVKARDTDGLESAYRTSATFTVQPPQYYYDKFNSVPIERYNDDAAYVRTGHYAVNFSQLAKSYTFDPVNNKYTKGTDLWQVGEGIGWMGEGYDVKTGVLYKYECTQTNTFVGSSNNAYENTRDPAQNTKSVTGYGRGTLVQTGIIGGATTYPLDGRHTDGYWYVRKSRVSQTIAPPTPFTSPTPGKKFRPNEVTNVAFGASNAANLSLYEVDFRYNLTGAWTPFAYNNTLTRSLTIPTDKTITKVEFRVRAKDTSNVYSDYIYSETFTIEHNVAPTVTITSPTDNLTLYENDVLQISGTANDTDPDQTVSAYYQINGEPRKVLATNVSQTQIVLSKQLTFKQGRLYDGENAITGILSDGVAHSLKIWAEDDQGAKSTEKVIPFYVVANRAPAITIDPFGTVSDLINNDEITITGTVSDPENNAVKVRYGINGGAFTEFYNDAPGVFTLKIKLDKLKTGENTIQFQVEDNYGFISTKSISANKKFNATPLLHSVARYKNTLPNSGINGMFVWIENMTGLTLDAEASMVIAGEQENFVAMEEQPPVPIDSENEESSFSISTETAKDDVAIKLNLSRADITSVEAITLITGALQTP